MQITRTDALIAVVLIGLGYGIGAKFGSPFKPAIIHEAAAPAVEQKDGSLIIEREAEQPKAKPAHKLPKGAKPERIVSVVVEPDPTEDGCEPAQVTVDLTVVRMQDGGKRVVASTPDGTIVGGTDIPVVSLEEQPSRWAAGLSFDPFRQATGVWIERNLSRFVVGVDLNQARQQTGGPSFMEGRIRVGFRF